MLQRHYIEQLLKMNGVSIDNSDDEIKAVLVNARWHQNDIQAAVLVFREDAANPATHEDSIHAVFRSDERLRPETISALLGIDSHITSKDIENYNRRAKGRMQPSQILLVACMALSLSVIFVCASMFYLEMGLFHKTLL